MTVTRGQKSTVGQTGNGSTIVTSWGTNPAAGNSVLVFVQCGVTPNSVVDNGTTPATFTLDAGGGSNAGVYIYRANNITLPSSGAYHVTVTVTGLHTIQALGIEYLGMKSGAPDATSSSLNVTSTSVTTGSAGPSAAGGVVFGGMSDISGLNPETLTFTGSAPQTSQLIVTNGGSFWPAACADALTGSAQAFTWTLGDSVAHDGAVAAYSPSITTHAGTAALSGSGTLSGAGVFAGAGALSGSGTLTGTPTHTSGARGVGTAALSGLGTLSGTATGAFVQVAALAGIGTLTGTWTGVLQIGDPGGYTSVYAATYPAPPGMTLSGLGSLQLSGVMLGFTAGLSGNGTLSVLQATGGLVFATPGAAVPHAYPLSSQVMVAPPGTQAWVPLGSVGIMTALTYSFTCPGGADKMTATIMLPATYRSQYLWPGWQVKITRGGHQVWDGKLDEPVPTTAGWTLTAVGTGNRGTDFLAVYTDAWPKNEPDQAVNNAISRGLPWQNTGIGTPSGAWFGQGVDSGAQTITSLLNLVCTRGGLTWYVNSQPGGVPGDDLNVFPLPAVVNRLLVCTQPVPRTLGGDINTIYLRYQATADTSAGGGTAATFALTSVQNAQSVTAHGVMETYIDISDAGVMTQAAAQAVGTKVLAIYQRASFAGPFTASYGQLLTAGGVPIDPGTDQAATFVKLILTDFSFGGEITPNLPVTFIVGSYTWDDLAQVATIVPYVNVDQSLTGLLSLANTELTPITVASA